MGTAWRLCQGRNPATASCFIGSYPVSVVGSSEFVGISCNPNRNNEKFRGHVCETCWSKTLFTLMMHLLTVRPAFMMIDLFIYLFNVAYAGWICVGWVNHNGLFLSEMLWFFLGQSPMLLGSSLHRHHRHLPPKRELQAIGSHSWESPSQDSPVWCTWNRPQMATDGHRWHGLVAQLAVGFCGKASDSGRPSQKKMWSSHYLEAI